MQISTRMYLILFLQLIKEAVGCPTYCACIWKNGKQTVECKKKNLLEIPEGLDPSTQVLDFSGNKIGSLYKDMFHKKQLVNLQRLFLSNSLIKSVDKSAFEGLTNLVELDLSSNLIDTIPSEAFIRCPSLMKLTLTSNPITALKKRSFEHLTQLNTLELSDCNISEIEEGAFQGLHSLEWLHLRGNRLKTIAGRRTLPEYVKGIELEKNSWECDCHIQDLARWLKDFKSLLSVEPVCQGPSRLASRSIRSIPIAELACLPTITPTSFYLELGEGKNVSLTCHIHAIPEATVSWWFQGEMLQNDTMVAPGIHLIYYVEEGTENKRSELFIYNANADDNGTFICNAENTAGSSQANFTIRIILKENPIVIEVLFPFEYILIAIVGIAVLGISVLLALIALIIKCRRNNKRRKKLSQTDEMVMQYQQNGNKLGDGVKSLSNSLKQINTSNQNDELTNFETQSCELMSSSTLSPVRDTREIRSPDSLQAMQLKQNPDIINGCRREGDGEDHQKMEMYANEFPQPLQIPIARLRESTEFLDGGRCIIDSEGYPIDYGLPKIPCRTVPNQFAAEAYYRTLPSNRLKRHSAANPFRRISREAEFLSRSVDSPYDNSVDVRYTADGYPARIQQAPIPGSQYPIESVMDSISPSSLPYCTVAWPTCVPANIHIINSNVNPSLNPNLNPNLNPSLNVAYQQCLSRRSASAQTDNDSGECAEQQFLSGSRVNINNASNNSNNNNSEPAVSSGQNDTMSELLTESPDEGYEGEPSVV
ncbi:leucine-rich repeat-containing protein 24-like [Diabrotica virgifera virgifera]|uniref:Ig-like domain-containing protein n=1 Tax=Diabrotica virgifera virgifera TaxID=50390 RepID=A0ABM5IQZ6_DIAVI|nr:leucine-rich repeat-containing protein 24-like [Diabrotica virgifera virgifera]